MVQLARALVAASSVAAIGAFTMIPMPADAPCTVCIPSPDECPSTAGECLETCGTSQVYQCSSGPGVCSSTAETQLCCGNCL